MLYAFLLSLLCTPAIGQDYIPQVRHFTIKDGLSSNEVQAIHKDQRGFMWIGTEYGLNRFDGQEFKVYTTENLPGLSSNIINKIMEDRAGNLWLTKTHERYEHHFTDIEISIFNVYTEEVKSLEEWFEESLPFDLANISYIEQLQDQRIFFHSYTQSKAFIYSTEAGFESFKLPENLPPLVQIYQQKDNHYLLSTAGFSAEEYLIHKITPQGDLVARRPDKMKWTVYDGKEEKRYQIWGALNLTAFDHFDPQLKLSSALLSHTTNSIYQTAYNPDQDLFWLRRLGQIDVINADGQLVYQHENVNQNLGEIPILFEQETTWLSTKKDGLYAITLQLNKFTSERFFKKDLDNSMRGIMTDKTGRLWFSTVHATGYRDADGEQSIIDNNPVFTCFFEDRKGYIWYHSYYDLIRHDLEQNKATRFSVASSQYIWGLFEADNGEIWLHTDTLEISALNPETGELKLKCKIPRRGTFYSVYDFRKHDEQSVWIGSNQGLFLYDTNGKLLAIYNDEQATNFYLPTKNIHHIYQDLNGKIWLATGDAGLLQLSINPATHAIEHYQQLTIKHGLSSNALHAIYPDDYGYFWISSDDGLMQFNIENQQITKYFKSNGLVHNEFNRIAHHQTKDGRLYFGGLHGLTSFHPKDFADTQEKTIPAALAIADFMQFSNETEQFEKLTSSVLQNNTIVLQPGDRFFNLKLALLDFNNGKNSIYSYRVKGLYDWQSSTNKELSISGLPFGEHILEIKAQNGNRQPAANKLAISVKVLRPFYLQWWFLLLVSSLLAGGVFVLVRRHTRQLLLKQEATQLRNLDQLKSRFFANISHELRTPITLIMGPLRQLLDNYRQQSNEAVEKQLGGILQQSKKLLTLVNEILDLSKLESEKLELEYKSLVLEPFLDRVVNVFSSAAAAQDIDYRFSSFIDRDMIIKCDPGKLEMIINNLLLNALKFTAKNGSITISTDWSTTNQLIFKVQDTGKGIHPEDLPNVFDRYYQSNQKGSLLEGGSGIGLAVCKEFIELMGGNIQVQSKLGKGSTFSFQIPFELATSLPIPEDQAETALSFDTAPLNPNIFSNSKETLLLVEDHPELRIFIQNILSPQYNVLTAGNGLEALEVLEKSVKSQQIPALIISDVMMPVMDGIDFLQKVKNDPRFCLFPFIILTARADSKNKLQALTIGVDDYMVKPFEAKELLLRIENLLKNVSGRSLPAPTIEVEEDPATIEQAPQETIAPIDLEWLKQVEEIAYREIQNSQFTFEQMARELLVSRRHMARKIKQITGLSPLQYLREIKLQKARQILEEQNISTLKEVSYAIGFENPSYFAKLYEERFGLRPPVNKLGISTE